MGKRILFIASHFYPNGSIVEAKNNYLSVLELERHGFVVDVAAPVDVQQYPKNVKYFIKNKSRTSRKAQVIRHLRKILKVPHMPTRFDDVSSILTGLKQIDFVEYDYIYTVFGNGSEHIAGLKLKEKYPHLKWIAEFRDPWVQNKLLKKYIVDNSYTWYADRQWKKLFKTESRVLEKVDLLLVESAYHGELIRKDFSFAKEICVCNGYSDKLIEDIPLLDIEFPNKPVIGFLGSTYYGYDDAADTFIRVLEELESEGVGFTFISIGNNAFSKLAETSLSINIFAFHRVPYLKSQAFIRKFTYGLAITMENYPNHVNSKIFEYMQYQVPTLAIAPYGGAMDDILTSSGVGLIVSYRKEKMKKQLRKILTDSSMASSKIDLSAIRQYDRNLVFDEIVKAIAEIK